MDTLYNNQWTAKGGGFAGRENKIRRGIMRPIYDPRSSSIHSASGAGSGIEPIDSVTDARGPDMSFENDAAEYNKAHELKSKIIMGLGIAVAGGLIITAGVMAYKHFKR